MSVAAGAQMMRQKLGLTLHLVREALLQHRSDAGMQFLPLCTQQRTVSGILNECVLEQIRRMRSGAPAKQQTGVAELSQSGL